MEEGHGTTWIRLASALAVDRPGGDTLEGRELGSRKARTLLALLAAERGALVPLDRIVEALWRGVPPADPAANVATLVSRTRRLLGADLLTATGRAYGLSARGPWVVDLDEASRLTAEAAARAAAGEAALAVAAAGSALELLGSQPALVDEDDADWVLRVRREADGLRRRARHLLAESLTPIEPAGAARVAAESVAADPFDEQAVRTLMRALVADGRASAALAAYDDLASRLREELGTSPDRESVDLHVSVLREADLPAEAPTRTPVERTLLVGREPELARAERAWAGLGAASTPALVLVEGEAGIGKTRFLDAVADLAAATGGRVLRGRCHPAERSLFLQPFVDALRPAILDSSPPALAALVRDHVAAWVSLVPELAPVVADGPPLPADVDLQRRQAYDAVVAVLRRLALDRPVLLTIDDLQDGGAATVDLLGYLAGRLGDARVLVVAAVRAEDAEVAARLADRAIARPARRPSPLRRRRPGGRLGPGRPRRAGDGPHGRAPAERGRVPPGARPGRHRRPRVAGRRGAGSGRPPRRVGSRASSRPPPCCAAGSTRPSWPPSSSPRTSPRPGSARSWSGCACSCAAATTTSSPTTSSRSACTPRCRRRSRSRCTDAPPT